MPENETSDGRRVENFLHRADGSSVSQAPVNDRVVSLTAPAGGLGVATINVDACPSLYSLKA